MTKTYIAGEEIKQGQWVRIGDDGKVYRTPELSEDSLDEAITEIKERASNGNFKITMTPTHRLMTGAELTAQHHENVAKQCACIVADILQQRTWTEEQWREAVLNSYTPNDDPFRQLIGQLSTHLERYISEATQAAALEWRDNDRNCYAMPITDEFAREFRQRILTEAREVLRIRRVRVKKK